MFEIPELLREYDRARDYTDQLWRDLSTDEVHWRPHDNFPWSILEGYGARP